MPWPSFYMQARGHYKQYWLMWTFQWQQQDLKIMQEYFCILRRRWNLQLPRTRSSEANAGQGWEYQSTSRVPIWAGSCEQAGYLDRNLSIKSDAMGHVFIIFTYLIFRQQCPLDTYWVRLDGKTTLKIWARVMGSVIFREQHLVSYWSAQLGTAVFPVMVRLESMLWELGKKGR